MPRPCRARRNTPLGRARNPGPWHWRPCIERVGPRLMTTTIDPEPESWVVSLPFDRPGSPDGGPDRQQLARDIPVSAGAIDHLAAGLALTGREAALAAWTVVLATYAGKPGL